MTHRGIYYRHCILKCREGNIESLFLSYTPVSQKNARVYYQRLSSHREKALFGLEPAILGMVCALKKWQKYGPKARTGSQDEVGMAVHTPSTSFTCRICAV